MNHININTDNLNSTFNTDPKSNKFGWKLAISEFDHELRYIKGDNNKVASFYHVVCFPRLVNQYMGDFFKLGIVAERKNGDNIIYGSTEIQIIKRVHDFV